MSWHKADAFDPASYRELAASCTAAVHTIGILLESNYKGAQGSLGSIFHGLARGWGLGGRGNPLAPPRPEASYDRMNRDAALVVARTLAETQHDAQRARVPFVYLSAEDVMRPLISPRYIESKREAEAGVEAVSHEYVPPALRPVFMRPGFMYHPHVRPWSTVPATLQDASYHLHRLHRSWKVPLPSPAGLLQSRFAPSALHPLAAALTTPPLHVDTVASAVCAAIDDGHVAGPQGVDAIKRLAEQYSFVPVGKGDGTRPLQKLVIDRQQNALHLQPVSIADKEPNYEKKFNVHGILGILSLHTSDFVVLITNRKRVTSLLGSTVYLATDFRLVPIKSDANPGLLRHPVERKLLSLVKEQLYAGPLYFSYDMDLTSSLQRQVKLGAGTGAASIPMWKRADPRFFWNFHLQRRLIQHSLQHPDADLSAFIMPVMFGFLEVKLATINDRSFVLGLVARRSRFRAGTRYFSRGIDPDGHVSNFNETEQFVLLDPPTAPRAESVEDIAGKIRLSFVQTRGSVPVYWAEVNNLRYKPDLLIQDSPLLAPSIRKHISEQVALYGKNYLVNLVNQKGYEKPVKDAFEHAVEVLGNPLVQYMYFDFHHECKGMKYDRIMLLVEQLERAAWSPSDYFSLDTTGAPRLQLQKSVVRTNCMDCLDRTNVVQGTLARCVLNQQLTAAGVLRPGERVDAHAKFIHQFRNIWADHADVISKAYSGTGALKTDFTRTGKRTLDGMVQDGLNSVTRYVKNNFFDGERQDAYDLFTGAWDPQVDVLRADTRSWFMLLVPWVVVVAIVFVAASFLLHGDASRPYHVDTHGVPVFALFWAALALLALRFMWQHGVHYVGWPTLRRPDDLIDYISGEAPREPVVSKKSGIVFEKRLIERYIEDNGKDPVTAEALVVDDLLPLKSCVYAPKTAFPKPPSHSSVPSLLMSLQNEYDAIVFEMFSLKKQYDSVRQDLAHALYTNDASMRVIARLIKERDEAREALGSVHQNLSATAAADGAPNDVDMDTGSAAPDTALPAPVAAEIDGVAAALSGERRARVKRPAPADYPVPATASSFHETHALPSLHGASSPGVTSVDVSGNGALLLTGGNDKVVMVHDRATDKVVSTLKGHTKAVSCVAFSGRANPDVGPEAADAPVPSYAVSGSADKTVRVWRTTDKGGYKLAHVLKGYKEDVVGVDVHPTDELVGSASHDGSWAIHSLETGAELLRVFAPEEDADGAGYAYTSFAFHPDGQLAATGTAGGAIRVWDVKQGKQSALLSGHAGAVHTLDFSQNGYILAAASRDSNEVRLWDLRKLSVSRVLNPYPESETGAVQQVRFDPTARLLAVVGAGLRMYGGKAWESCFAGDTAPASQTGVQWSPVDGALAVSALDRTVRVYAVA
ncbi:Phosphoinositide phosphatase sac1 [Malassezia sp. CBS 17886]|nr:Phosphoinositide phosphatase sac1 [Malassezia sp. CBS 17886]